MAMEFTTAQSGSTARWLSGRGCPASKCTCSSGTSGRFPSYSRLKRLPLHRSRSPRGGESPGSSENTAPPYAAGLPSTPAAAFHIPVCMFHWNICPDGDGIHHCAVREHRPLAKWLRLPGLKVYMFKWNIWRAPGALRTPDVPSHQPPEPPGRKGPVTPRRTAPFLGASPQPWPPDSCRKCACSNGTSVNTLSTVSIWVSFCRLLSGFPGISFAGLYNQQAR